MNCGPTSQADLTKKRLERAGKLTSALADEGVRWKSTAETLQAATDLLVGDVFLSAACIAYYGAFTGAYRHGLVESWIAACKGAAIPVSSDCTLRKTLASPVEVRCLDCVQCAGVWACSVCACRPGRGGVSSASSRVQESCEI